MSESFQLVDANGAMHEDWTKVDPLDLVEMYTERTGIAEYEGGLSRDRAERSALLYIDEHYLVLKRKGSVAVTHSPACRLGGRDHE